MSHARDATAKYSVRKQDPNLRKRAREAKSSKKVAAKQLREEEKARLRKLKVAEAEGNIQKIKDAHVDEQMDVEEKLKNFGKRHASFFRYRETSPTAYGLTPHDILMASDSQLNQYAGLRKMATFRDSEKKRKNKKRLGKKARLRQWRKETFGDELGPQHSLTELLAGRAGPSGAVDKDFGNGVRHKETASTQSRLQNKRK
jgi:protein KRI1